MDQGSRQVIHRVESAKADDQVIALVGEGQFIVEALRRINFLYRDTALLQRGSQFPGPFTDDQRAVQSAAVSTEKAPVVAGLQPLRVLKPLRDVVLPAGGHVVFDLPADALTADPSQVVLTLRASLADGSALPAWIRFDPSTGRFELSAPDAPTGDVQVKLLVTGADGQKTVLQFNVLTGEKRSAEKLALPGRQGLSEKLKLAATSKMPAFVGRA